MKKLFSILIVLGMLCSLAACGGEKDPNAGLYEAVTATAYGRTVPIENIYDAGAAIELKSDGKATVRLDENKLKGSWTLSGEELTVTIGGRVSVGTLVGGTISIDILDIGTMIDYQIK